MIKQRYKGPTWPQARKQIKVKFAEAGIFRCELGYEGCTGTNFLSFAHSLRRNKIFLKEEMEEVILACTKCHAQLDGRPHEETYEIVNEIRMTRPIKVRSIYDRVYK